jgi:N-acetyl-anhydromuramyl-L-alanine amidase AmpD
MRDIDMVVIHCSATRQGKDYTVDTLRSWHKQRGFNDIGYHFIIHLDGRIEKGRPIEKPGAHAKGFNTQSIGVCYVGGLGTDNKAKDTRTVSQIHALRSIVEVLKVMFPIERVVGHRDLSVDLNGDGVITPNEWMKSCPCFDVQTEL